MSSSESSKKENRDRLTKIFGSAGILVLLISGATTYLQWDIQRRALNETRHQFQITSQQFIQELNETRHQFQQTLQDEINYNIEEMYLVNGLDLIISDLARYGLTCTVSIDEVRVFASREYEYEGIINLINYINKRDLVMDILEFKYDSSDIWYKIIPFGWPVYGAVLHGFQTYSYMLRDIMYIEEATHLLEIYDKTEFIGNIQGGAYICQNIELYLTIALQKITIEIRSQHITSWSEIHKLNELETIKNIQEELEQFNNMWIEWWDSTGNERQQLFNELNDWLVLHTNTS